jgi:hypothetical protein
MASYLSVFMRRSLRTLLFVTPLLGFPCVARGQRPAVEKPVREPQAPAPTPTVRATAPVTVRAPLTTAPAPPPVPASPLVTRITGMELITGYVNAVPAKIVHHVTRCPIGKVVSGGYAYVETAGPSAGVRILGRYPSAGGSTYEADVLADLLQPTSTLFVQAICMPRPDGYTVTQVSRTIAPRERATIDAACPASLVMIGGGASTEEGVYLAGSSPRSDGLAWSAFARSDAVIGAKTVTSHVICASPRAIPGRRQISTAGTALASGTGRWQGPFACSMGEQPLSIGIASNTTLINQPNLKRDPTPAPTTGILYWNSYVENTAPRGDAVVVDARLIAICTLAGP